MSFSNSTCTVRSLWGNLIQLRVRRLAIMIKPPKSKFTLTKTFQGELSLEDLIRLNTMCARWPKQTCQHTAIHLATCCVVLLFLSPKWPDGSWRCDNFVSGLGGRSCTVTTLCAPAANPPARRLSLRVSLPCFCSNIMRRGTFTTPVIMKCSSCIHEPQIC